MARARSLSAKVNAEKLDVMKNEFLGKMSREIRTPLNNVIGCAGLLEGRPDQPKEQKQFAHTIMQASRQVGAAGMGEEGGRPGRDNECAQRGVWKTVRWAQLLLIRRVAGVVLRLVPDGSAGTAAALVHFLEHMRSAGEREISALAVEFFFLSTARSPPTDDAARFFATRR